VGFPNLAVIFQDKTHIGTNVFFPEAGLKFVANNVKALSPKVDVLAKSSATHAEPCKRQFIDNIVYMFLMG